MSNNPNPPIPNPEKLAQMAQAVMASRQGEIPAKESALQPTAAQTAQPASDEEGPQFIQQSLDTMNFLRMAVAKNISDIHFRIGYPPIIRKDGDMVYTKLPVLTESALDDFIKHTVPQHFQHKMAQNLDFDFNFEIPGLARFRVNWFHEMNQPGLVLRIIKVKIPDISELGLPLTLGGFANLHKGLVLVTGPTGSGKSTTLAAILNQINKSQCKHIITLEDPIEYVYTSQRSVITQRQLGIDTDSFPHGIKYALRQDPDVILVGEMRDRETIMAALHAAETGHMVFSTLHTINAVQTMYRIINMFEPHEREQIRRQIASVLQGTVSQRLLKRADGEGRLAVAEIMHISPAIRDYILRDEVDEIYRILNSPSNGDGSISMNFALYKLVQEGLITEAEAMGTTESPTEMSQLLRGFYSHSEV